MNLRYDLYGSPNEHPQKVMKSLGITYQHATPQSMGDCWWFWNCKNVPTPLPEYLSELTVKPHDAIGHGLDKKLADWIVTGGQFPENHRIRDPLQAVLDNEDKLDIAYVMDAKTKAFASLNLAAVLQNGCTAEEVKVLLREIAAWRIEHYGSLG